MLRSLPPALACFMVVGAFVPGLALAGPHEGGTLILHSADIVFCLDEDVPGDLCGTSQNQDPLLDCNDAVVHESTTSAVYPIVYAAFPATSSPRLAGIVFGIEYDPFQFYVLYAQGCGDFELPTGNWPNSGEGTAVTWNTAQTDHLVQIYFFAGYNYYGEDTSFDLIPHPIGGGNFADDAIPSNLDPIANYGRLGFFGDPGYLPCPIAGDPFGACCFDPNCVCTVLMETECAAQGGSFLGDGTTCTPNPCACIFGACCFPDGSCLELLQIDCVGQGGSWLGENTRCEPFACDPVPVEETSWGEIKATYR